MLEKKLELELTESTGGEVSFIDNFSDIFDEIKRNKYNAVILDGDELKYEKLIEVIERILNVYKKMIVIVIGERAGLNVIAGSVKAGAYDYLMKPVDGERIKKIIEKALKDQKLKAEKVGTKITAGEEKIIGSTPAMVDVYKMVGKVASSNVSVLITGEKGTGKQLVAKAIHKFSERQEMPFMTINCSAMQDIILERKIFGYEQGAFKGAVISQVGELEKANGGTLFLGNIEDLSLDSQVKILSVLQEGEFFRIGGTTTIKVDLRLVASTSQNLEELIVEGKFSEELYHRLKVLDIEMPALRERKDDIPFLIDHYIQTFNDEFQKSVKGVSKPAINKIMKYDWPGNVRELQNAIKSAMALCRGSSLLIEDLPANVIGAKISKRHGDIQDWVLADWIEGEISILKSNNQKNYYGNIISRVERELIRQVLEITNGKKVETAEILGITRNTLRTKMNNYGLE
jgi:two-component system nitrogen regulation response regulator GlnG